MSKSRLYRAGPAIICLLLNLLISHSFPYALINSGLLFWGLRYFPLPEALIFSGGITLMPLLYWEQTTIIPGLLTLVAAAGIYLTEKSRLSRWPVLIIFVLVPLTLAVMQTNGILNIPPGGRVSFDREKLFPFQSESRSALTSTTLRFKTDLWWSGVPFQRSAVVHNNLVSGLNIWFKNLTEYLNPPNLYKPLLLANLYLIILGFGAVIKDRDRFFITGVLVSMAAFGVIVGLSLHGGSEGTLYPLLPWLLYLAGRGSRKAEVKFYLILFVGQLVLLGWF